MSDDYYSRDELLALGFSEVGQNVSVSRKSSLYAISGSLGSNVRIDDFCILKGRIRIGSYVHIGSHCSISGARAEVSIAGCVSLSTRVTIFTGTDSYVDACLNGPMVPQEFVTTLAGPVRIGQGAVIGAHTVILPNVEIGDGASIGAMCIINDSCPAGSIVVCGGGRPRTIGTRDTAAILAQVQQVQASKA
jgi:dTDP-4-amino-4,6-dideoxy-D-glucose acyltransferase